jgi:hypothetical protein
MKGTIYAVRKLFISAAVLFAVPGLLFASGCARSITKTTDRGAFRVKIIGKGRIIRYGRNEVVLKITDAKNQAVEGAQIAITPWMPKHGHGSPWPPTVTEQGGGRYRVVIPIIMLGDWELRITIKKGDEEDNTVFKFPDVEK